MTRRLPNVVPAIVLVAAAACSRAARPATAPAPEATPRVAEGAPPPDARARAVHDSLAHVLTIALTDSAFPGAFAITGNGRGVLAQAGVGRLDWDPSPVPDAATLWDLASLTKVIGMTTAMMQLVERHRVDIDLPVQHYLPEFTGPNKDRVTVRHLLTHSSGLPAWRPLYKEATSPANGLELVLATQLDTLPGTRMVYSDLGAILLGEIVHRVSGEPLDRYLARHVFGPLGMGDTRYRPDATLRNRIAPTEYDPWRQRKVHGEVHDENAYSLGGISGHAGLFSSGRDLARFARMYLNGGILDGVRIVSEETIRTFTTIQNAQLSNRALGWEKPNGTNSAGHRLSARAFGHTGFTGTSIWIDPERDFFLVLLTNRVNPTRQNNRIGGVRISLADAVSEAFDNGGPGNGREPHPPFPSPR